MFDIKVTKELQHLLLAKVLPPKQKRSQKIIEDLIGWLREKEILQTTKLTVSQLDALVRRGLLETGVGIAGFTRYYKPIDGVSFNFTEKDKAECERCKKFFIKTFETQQYCSRDCGTRANGKDIEDQFNKFVIKTGDDSCWRWSGHSNVAGYGVITSRYRRYLAHRVAYTLYKGPLTKEDVIDHVCRNVECCNPGHLNKVTTAMNTLRGLVGMQKFCKYGHPREPLSGPCKVCYVERKAQYKPNENSLWPIKNRDRLMAAAGFIPAIDLLKKEFGMKHFKRVLNLFNSKIVYNKLYVHETSARETVARLNLKGF